LKEIAEITTLHESTISRVTTNKYMATPNGIFELKFFFSSSLQNAFGDQDISSEFVRQRVKNLIQNEVFPNILADDTLVGLLQKEGITIARRTVTKYRESMNLQSSIVRRQQKRPLTQTG
ncbi:MAG: RNA polymerase sigma-54 factor, partial [Alphaproteobacteria bacterium]|nr:RNA polymerase sigma-54 factor [Alphaproteobacteria bacterium]